MKSISCVTCKYCTVVDTVTAVGYCTEEHLPTNCAGIHCKSVNIYGLGCRHYQERIKQAKRGRKPAHK